MSFQVGEREVRYDPQEVIECEICRQRKPRFDGSVQNYKDTRGPKMCLACQRTRRRKAEVVDKQARASLVLDAYYRHLLEALAFKFDGSYKVVVQRALDALLVGLPAREQQEVRLLLTIRERAGKEVQPRLVPTDAKA